MSCNALSRKVKQKKNYLKMTILNYFIIWSYWGLKQIYQNLVCQVFLAWNRLAKVFYHFISSGFLELISFFSCQIVNLVSMQASLSKAPPGQAQDLRLYHLELQFNK